jgi:hypothetical protein
MTTPGRNSLVPLSGLQLVSIIPSGAATLHRRFSDGMLPPVDGKRCLVPAFKLTFFFSRSPYSLCDCFTPSRLTPGPMTVPSALTPRNNCLSTRMVAGFGFLVLVLILPLAPTVRSGLSTPVKKCSACCLARTSGKKYQVV